MMASNRALKFLGVFLMTDHLPQSRTSQSFRPLQSSVLSARKLALMASVVIGLGIAVYGVSPSSGGLDIFGSPAHAQANNVVPSAAQPQGFADLVERVKPSVISVKVTMKERVSDAANQSDDGGSGSPMERFFRQFRGPDGVPQNPGREGRQGEMMGPGAGFFIFSDGVGGTNKSRVEGSNKVEVTTYAAKHS